MHSADTRARFEAKLAAYEPLPATLTLVQSTPILLLVGISGAGKDTLMHELLKTGKYRPIVSHTTRQPRINDGVLEQDGVEYHFITLEKAEAMLDAGVYVEVKPYGGNVYGTSVAEIQAAHDAGKVAVTDIEVQGVAEYVAINPKVHAVFVLPPDYETWQARLSKRYGGQVDEAELEKRMRVASGELSHALSAPYFMFVVNDAVNRAANEIDMIVHAHTSAADAAAARKVAEAIRDRLTSAHIA